ncbi:hypothetical protein TRIP_C20170 [Candidatus Zixiibacteriota bacterium]|nr:hypothetical protein TRIP_C20170 [candidate division Zixibacteria bacterium]
MSKFITEKFRLRADNFLPKFLRRLKHAVGFGVILVLPVGIYQNDPESTSVVVTGHIGAGQYASVIRGCNGPIGATKNDFNDYAVGIHVAVPPRANSPVVIGFRYGEWRSDYRYPIRAYDEYNNRYIIPSEPSTIRFHYVNPSISYENRMVGIGFGYITGKRPEKLSPDENSLVADGSFHARIGDMRRAYFITSFNENTPLVSGGGYYDIGLGFVTRQNLTIYVGVGGGIYDSPGFMLQSQIPLDKHLHISGAFRYGRVAGVGEVGFAGGLIGRF